MIKYRVLLAIPLAFGLVHLLGFFFFSERSWYQDYLYIEILVVKWLSFSGYLVAARQFQKGEYLRLAWLFMAGCSLMFFFSDLLFRSFLPGLIGQEPSLVLRGLVLTLGNFCLIVGAWMLARTWHAAGLEFPGPRWKKWLTVFGAIALAVILAGPAARSGLGGLLNGKLEARNIINLVSATADIIALSLVAPMLMTALALRGGLLRWPWVFLTSILLSWLGFDAVFSWGPIFGLSEQTMQCTYELFRVLACMFGVSAGLAQRFVLGEIQDSPAHTS